MFFIFRLFVFYISFIQLWEKFKVYEKFPQLDNFANVDS